jgi:hypothetical protein
MIPIPIKLKYATDSAKGHASVVDSELSSMFRAHPLGEFEKRNKMGMMVRMKPSNVPVKSHPPHSVNPARSLRFIALFSFNPKNVVGG